MKPILFPFKRKRKLSDGRIYVIETDCKTAFNDWMKRIDKEEKKIKEK